MATAAVLPDDGPSQPVTSLPTVGQLLDARAAGDPGRLAVMMPGRSLTYAELAAASRRVAAHLLALDVRPGDVVGLLSDADIDTVITILAAARIGAVSLPINNRFRADELRHVIDNGDVRALMVAERFGSEIREALPSLTGATGGRLRIPEAPNLRHIADLAASSAVRERAERLAQLQSEISADDDFVIIYTSGTTSRPRGCVHTHAGYVQQAKELAEGLRLGRGDRFWTALPFFHVGGYDVLLASLWAGCTLVHAGVFDPERALRQLADEFCTVAFPAFETIWRPVVGHPRFAEFDLSALRAVVNVATPELLHAMQQRLPRAVQVSCTGSTESAGFCCIGSLDDPPEVRACTVGRINPGMEARIVDPDSGDPLPDGTPGEFVFRGAYRFRHYHRDPELTQRRIDSEGWFHSGDVLVRDSEGRFSFLGRLGDSIKVGGENVSPLEVEEHLTTHPAVNMAQVVAAPDVRYGEVPAAFVMLNGGVSATESELIDFCLGSIATFKVPRYVFFVTEWPMSGTKIQKFVLRDGVAEYLARQGVTEAPRLTSHRGS